MEEDEFGDEYEAGYWEVVDGNILSTNDRYSELRFINNGIEMRIVFKGPFFGEEIANAHLDLIKD